jgi:hypothetical protein
MFTIKNSWDPCICAYEMEASAHYAQVWNYDYRCYCNKFDPIVVTWPREF